MKDSYEWIRQMTAEVLQQVVAGVKEARKAGVDVLMPDIVAFDVELPQMNVLYEVPLNDEGEEKIVNMEREAAKMNFSFPFVEN